VLYIKDVFLTRKGSRRARSSFPLQLVTVPSLPIPINNPLWNNMPPPPASWQYLRIYSPGGAAVPA